MTSLIRAVEVLSAGSWPERDAIDQLVLTYDERHRRRMRYVAAGGTTFLLDLARATVLRAGDGLRLEDGRILRVEAAPEQLVQVTAPDTATLVRLAWHIGNRHLPAQLEPHRILIGQDAVIESMLRGLGGTVEPVMAPFMPEAGAYDKAVGAVGHSHSGQPDHHAHEHHGHGDHDQGSQTDPDGRHQQAADDYGAEPGSHTHHHHDQ